MGILVLSLRLAASLACRVLVFRVQGLALSHSLSEAVSTPSPKT